MEPFLGCIDIPTTDLLDKNRIPIHRPILPLIQRAQPLHILLIELEVVYLRVRLDALRLRGPDKGVEPAVCYSQLAQLVFRK